MFEIRYRAALPAGTISVLAPFGMTTPQSVCRVAEASGETREISESSTGQTALLITPDRDHFELTYRFDEPADGRYADAVFEPHDSRFTRVAEALIEEVGQIAPDQPGLVRATAIARAMAEKFTYGHPESKFNDGLDHIPALGCGLTEGSCVDINTYFLASLRAAGISAGYVTGFFFPAEKGDHCTDGHCWVVTRIAGETQEWDIAHHLKMGTREIAPGLNPKPGRRAACFHGMGLNFEAIGLAEHKALIEPLALTPDGIARFEAPEIRLLPVPVPAQ